MKLSWSSRGLSLFAQMRLRWRLVIAFISVSAVPVLLACYIAADIISASFASSLERWLEQAAVFFADRSAEDEEEARQAASVIAASLGTQAASLGKDPIDFSAHLLTSVGYDAVAVYDEDGHVLFVRGPVGDGAWLPRAERSSFFVADDGGNNLLLMGASQRFEREGKRYYAFVADRWDGLMVDIADGVPGVVIDIYTVSGGKARQAGGGATPLPPGVLKAFAGGAHSLIVPAEDDEHLAAGYAALRDEDGALVGIVSCRLANRLSLLAHVRAQELFLALAAGAAFISLLVALSLSALISRPLTNLTGALRGVREGNFRARVAEKGGGELTELAVGFNEMAARLEMMREREAEVRRREQLATLGEAAAVLAHEIRNPLGIIKTSSQVLRMTADLPTEGEKLIGFVLDEVGRIDHLVHDLLDYARPRTLRRAEVDIAAELDDVLAFAANDLEQRGIRTRREGALGPLFIQADGEQLHQVFLNILLNAMEAMPDGGCVTVGIDMLEDTVQVRIADTGRGVDPDIKDRLFDPFVTTKPRGTGLGLARVRHIVEQHGGTVTCDSRPGIGTCFILHLPKSPSEQGEAS